MDDGLDNKGSSALEQDNLPISKIEVAEPITLGARLVDVLETTCDDSCSRNVPKSVSDLIDDFDFDETDLAVDNTRELSIRRQVVATVGLFSIIKLARIVQLLIPAFDFCVPNKQCIAATEENPCELFDTIDFPIDEFFPPQKADFPGALEDERAMTKDEF